MERKNCSIEGMGDFMLIENENDAKDNFFYLNSPEKGVFCGFMNNNEFEIYKYFDYNMSEWKTRGNITCSVIENLGMCKVRATDGTDTIYYYYNALLGLPEYEETKGISEDEEYFLRFIVKLKYKKQTETINSIKDTFTKLLNKAQRELLRKPDDQAIKSQIEKLKLRLILIEKYGK